MVNKSVNFECNKIMIKIVQILLTIAIGMRYLQDFLKIILPKIIT